jgi:hypothetical protein
MTSSALVVPFATNGEHERAVHRALKERVEEAGQAAPRILYQRFDEFNATFFRGALKPAVILLTPTSPRAFGDYSETDLHGLKSRIRIAPHVWSKRGELFAADVLLHEMVHGFCHEILNDGEPGYRGHGQRFASKCNDIGTTLGLAEVFPNTKKNRELGRPNCAQWPHCVRGKNFYGQEDIERPKKPKAESKDDTALQETIARLVDQLRHSEEVIRSTLKANGDMLLACLTEEDDDDDELDCDAILAAYPELDVQTVELDKLHQEIGALLREVAPR